jgi:extradiol dioxygenase family protein
MSENNLFHLAIPIGDIPQTKAFYVTGLGCQVGRETDNALILDFYGHQVVAHVTPTPQPPQKGIYPTIPSPTREERRR